VARRRNRNRLLVPEASQGMEQFKGEVMRREGYQFDPSQPNEAKYAVAERLGIPMGRGRNEMLPTRSVGKVGGEIGGKMVRELVRMAQEQLTKKDQNRI
jgi:small acid-soluble spore protein D (minor alpha/beta-type SASP)